MDRDTLGGVLWEWDVRWEDCSNGVHHLVVSGHGRRLLVGPFTSDGVAELGAFEYADDADADGRWIPELHAASCNVHLVEDDLYHSGPLYGVDDVVAAVMDWIG